MHIPLGEYHWHTAICHNYPLSQESDGGYCYAHSPGCVPLHSVYISYIGQTSQIFFLSKQSYNLSLIFINSCMHAGFDTNLSVPLV